MSISLEQNLTAVRKTTCDSTKVLQKNRPPMKGGLIFRLFRKPVESGFIGAVEGFSLSVETGTCGLDVDTTYARTF